MMMMIFLEVMVVEVFVMSSISNLLVLIFVVVCMRETRIMYRKSISILVLSWSFEIKKF
jgi:hypothetical protein